jgi:uncharacterized protein YndB with AHSA1/START domain
MTTKNDSVAAARGCKLIVSRVISAPSALVFRAWTEPAQLMQWFGPAEVELRSLRAEVKIGGAFRVHFVSEKGDHIATGSYREIVPNRRLKFSWSWEHYAMPDSVVTVDFEDLGKTTRLTLVHEGLPDQEDADDHTKGWTSMIEKFARLMNQNEIKFD